MITGFSKFYRNTEGACAAYLSAGIVESAKEASYKLSITDKYYIFSPSHAGMITLKRSKNRACINVSRAVSHGLIPQSFCDGSRRTTVIRDDGKIFILRKETKE